jgi:hypothetical protein
MGTLSEFLVGDTPVMARGGFAEIPDIAAQIEPTMSQGSVRSLDRSIVVPVGLSDAAVARTPQGSAPPRG